MPASIRPYFPLPVLLSALLACLPGTVLAGPYETGSTSTAKGIKFKSNVQWKHTASQDSWVLPKIGIGGPLGERLEMSIGTGYGVVSKTGTARREGLRDLSVGLKWRLLDEHGTRPALAIEPSLTLPTGDRASGIGSDAYSLDLPVRASRRHGNVRFTGEVRWSHTFGEDADQWRTGLLAEYLVDPARSFGMELVADAPAADLGQRHVRANVGTKIKVGTHVQWQLLVGRSLDNRRGDKTSTVKLAWEYLF